MAIHNRHLLYCYCKCEIFKKQVVFTSDLFNVEQNVKICECPYSVGDIVIKNDFAWKWSNTDKAPTAQLSDNGLSAFFHTGGFSGGTSWVRGDTPFTMGNHYFWEVRAMAPLFGRAVMVGVGTANIPMSNDGKSFFNFLGDSEESWGFNYDGTIYHKGKKLVTNTPFFMGSIIGVYLDLWNGTLEFFLNRQRVGKKFTGLKNLTLYPILTSTAAPSALRLTTAIMTPHSLFYKALRQLSINQFEKLPYALREKINDAWWFLPKSSYGELKPAPLCYNNNILITIETEEEDNVAEFHRSLAMRMKRVLENSVVMNFKRNRYSE